MWATRRNANSRREKRSLFSDGFRLARAADIAPRCPRGRFRGTWGNLGTDGTFPNFCGPVAAKTRVRPVCPRVSEFPRVSRVSCRSLTSFGMTIYGGTEVESRPLQKTQGAGHPGGQRSGSNVADRSVRSTQPSAWMGVGVLRLRSCFASRSGYSAQDDILCRAPESSSTTAGGCRHRAYPLACATICSYSE